MKAIRIDEHGGPEVLRVIDLEPVEPGAGEVVVDVTHVALNHLDVWVRRGVEGHRFPLPLIPGSDAAGVRTDTGEAVVIMPAVACMQCRRCLEGRHDLCRQYRIRGEGTDGCCREQVAVPAWQLLPVPAAMKPEEACCLPLALLTAWHMLIDRAGVQPGDQVLVQGGAGGVGSLAIQVARLVGARVAATASTPEKKRALCLELGAEQAWDYDEAVARAKQWTGRAGLDIVVENVGGPTWEDSVRMVRWGGTVVTCGATTGHEVPLNLRVLFFKQLSLLGSTMGSFGELRQAWDAVQAGHIRPVLHQVGSMRDLGAMHALLEDRAVLGKVVVAQDLGAS